ncbi:hypothetical protein KIL84_001695 [Mauremys mutica]|uniref:Uncharacterized protein n=1 Tax=Mauremys mutica TaxID=74926 RepID=A0A9D3XJ72_9SAUR|nr:hypothetical protein KIL84_001695 [Mauremys mutica]
MRPLALLLLGLRLAGAGFKICAFNTQGFGEAKSGDTRVMGALVQNVMLLGDLNAGGPYVPPSAWGSIRLRWDPRFHWLIGDGVDTTVRARTHCAYDRIVVQGDELLRAVVPGSAKAYNFARSLGLSEEEALQVSDHYPVEVNLRLASRTPREL